MSYVLSLPCEKHVCKSSSNVPRLPSFLKLLQNQHVWWLSWGCGIHGAYQSKWRFNIQKRCAHGVLLAWRLRNTLRATAAPNVWQAQLPQVNHIEMLLRFWLRNMLRTTAAYTFWTALSASKSASKLRCFPIFIWKRASRHGRVHFLNGVLSCFQFWLGNKYASRHSRVHLCNNSTSKHAPSIEHGVLFAVWLRNVLRATAACSFWSLIRPNVSAPAALASLLFSPPEPQNIW